MAGIMGEEKTLVNSDMERPNVSINRGARRKPIIPGEAGDYRLY
jgi:hypothetical protein